MLMKHFCFLSMIVFVKCSDELKQNAFFKPSVKQVNINLIKALNITTEEVFLKKYTTVNVITAVENPEDLFFLDFKSALLLENKGSCIYRLDSHTNIQVIKTRPKIHNIILLDNYKSFKVFNKNLTPDKFNFRGLFIFVFLYGNFIESPKIFEVMWKKNIINVNAIFEEIDEKGETFVKLVTFLPFQRKLCGDTSPVVIDRITNASFNIASDKIFPMKLKNLQRCKIRLVTFDRCPASCVEEEDGKLKVHGFDIGIIDTIADRMNFKLVKEILTGPEMWGNVFPNKTTGAIAKILANESDIAIGNYILRSNRVFLMDNSVVYFSFPVVFAIPLGDKLTSFEKLLRPFELIVWICLVLTLATGVLVIVVLTLKYRRLRSFVYGTGIRNPLINMIVVIFGGSSKKLPRRNFARFILMAFLLFCLVQRNVYQGLLYIFLQTDGRNKEVQSIDEMSQKNFDFYLYESYVDIIENIPRIYNKRKIIQNEDNFIFNKPLEESVNAAFMTSLTDVIYKNQQSYKEFVLNICREHLVMVNIVMYFPKHFYLREAIDQLLYELSAAGILQFWIQKYADTKFLIMKKRKSGPKPLEIHHLFGIFNLCMIGLTVSLVIFLMELTGSIVRRAFRIEITRRVSTAPEDNS